MGIRVAQNESGLETWFRSSELHQSAGHNGRVPRSGRSEHSARALGAHIHPMDRLVGIRGALCVGNAGLRCDVAISSATRSPQA